MRKVPAAIAAMALLVAACADDIGDSTTTAEPNGTPPETTTTKPDTTTTEQEPTTTTLADGSLIYDCATPGNAALSNGVMCADYAVGIFSDLNTDSDVLNFRGSGPMFPLAIQVDNQSCVTFPQVLVFPDEVDNPEGLGLTKADFSGFEGGDEFQAYLDAIQLGVYDVDPAELFVAIDAVEAAGDVAASPHYLVGPTQTWKYGPAGLPTSVSGRWEDLPTNKNPDDVSDGRVIVVDTGGSADVDLGIAKAEPEPLGLDPLVAGHGQFAASIVKRYNPDLTVEVFSASSGQYGQMSELSVVAAIGRVADIDGSVVNLSLGTYPCSPADPPLGLALGLSLLPQELTINNAGQITDIATANVLFVAAAGNDGDNEPQAMYPARLSSVSIEDILGPDIVNLGDLAELIDQLVGPASVQASVYAVGASDPAGDQAGFSNPGDFYVPGVDVVGWYEPDQSLAVWSGTSFAAPRFAACLASGACPP